MGRKLKDYSGQIHGCWKVIERDKNPKSKSHEIFWICKCLSCGKISSVRKSVLDKNPKNIIYMSCNPMTISRDLKLLTNNYKIEKIYLLDMFSYTYHIESILILNRK